MKNVNSRVKFSSFEGVNFLLEYEECMNTYGDTPIRTGREWFHHFKSGDINVEDQHHFER